MGYLGGGLLLAINIVMLQYLPGTWGARVSFLSVAIWWAVFSIPLFRWVPEPPSATAKLVPGETVVGVSVRRLWETLKDIRQYRELFEYLVAFLIYADGIGTIIGVAAIYGAELGFGSNELILALLLVQFVGIPFSLIFGRLPSRSDTRRPFYLAFVLFNLIALPLAGISGARLLSADIAGSPPSPYTATATAVGEGTYLPSEALLVYNGTWQSSQISADELGTELAAEYRNTTEAGASYSLPFNGQTFKLTYSLGPDHGIWAVLIDGQPLIDDDSGEAVTIDAYNATTRYGSSLTKKTREPGEHTLTLVNTGERNPESQGSVMTLAEIQVLPPVRKSNLGIVVGLIVTIEIIGLLLSWILGGALFARLADTIDTKRSIILALVVYAAIAIWGFFLDSVIEFWFLAWMVAVVQGGSQALSRSLFASMAPAAKSGEFFGLFGIMEKFSAILGPLIFAWAATTFGSSRPAVLSIIAFFIVGGFLLTRVDVDEGRRVAKAEDAVFLKNQIA